MRHLIRASFIISTLVVLLLLAAVALNAQSAPSKPLPSGTQILFLGTAGGPPLRLDRSEPATLLIVDGRMYLIDCGIGTMRRLLEAGIPSEQIKTIFFTHLHADHDLGLADVMANDYFSLNLLGSSETMDIYGPPQTAALVDAAFHYLAFGFTAFAAEPSALGQALKARGPSSPFIAHEIAKDGLVYSDDKVRVTAAENSHYTFMEANDRKRMKSYSYRIETPHGVVVFTGDTGPSDAVARLAKGADVLVSEVLDLDETAATVKAMAQRGHWPRQRATALMAHMRQEHLDQQEVGNIASTAHVKAVLLYHYDPEDPAAEVARLKKFFRGPVFASADLDRYCLNQLSGGPALSPCPTSAPKP